MIALLLLVSGIKCLDKAYEINKELDKEGNWVLFRDRSKEKTKKITQP